MPRLRNRENGAVVNVDDATAARLGSGWVSADAQPEPAVKPSTRTKKTDK